MKTKTKRVMALILVACVMATMITVCGGKSLAAGNSKAVKPLKLGFSVWGTSDEHGRTVTEATRWAVKDLDGEMVVDQGAMSPETQVTSIENLIQAGCNVISFCAYTGDASVARIAQTCKDAGVYFVIWDTDITDVNVKAALQNNPYYVGNTNEDQQATGYDGVKNLAAEGVKNLVLVKYGVGVATCDLREKGARQAAKKYGINIAYTIVAPQDSKKAMQDVLIKYSNIDGLFILGNTAAYFPPMLSAIKTAGKAGKVKVAAFDFFDSMKSSIQSGDLNVIYGGHIVTTTFAALMAANKFYGTPLNKKAYKTVIPYIKITSAQDVEDYSEYIAQQPPYNGAEVKQFIKLYNKALTQQKFQEMVSKYSIADVKSRHK